MINLKSKIFVVVTLTALQGCSGMIMAPGEVAAPFKETEITYVPKKFSSTTFANASPQDLSGVDSETLKVLALLGYPTIKSHPVYKFNNYLAENSSKETVKEFFAGNAPVAKTGNSVAQDFFLTAGLAGDISPLGAVVGVAGTGSGWSKRDPRVQDSTALCFKPEAEFDAAGALESCFKDFDNHISSAFAMQEPAYKVVDKFFYKVTFPLANGKRAISTIKVDRFYSDHSLGYAPIDRGGYKAHMIKIRFSATPDGSPAAAPYKVEELAGVFAKKKPDSLVYLISPASDQQGRKDIEPFGIY